MWSGVGYQKCKQTRFSSDTIWIHYSLLFYGRRKYKHLTFFTNSYHNYMVFQMSFEFFNFALVRKCIECTNFEQQNLFIKCIPKQFSDKMAKSRRNFIDKQSKYFVRSEQVTTSISFCLDPLNFLLLEILINSKWGHSSLNYSVHLSFKLNISVT